MDANDQVRAVVQAVEHGGASAGGCRAASGLDPAGLGEVFDGALQGGQADLGGSGQVSERHGLGAEAANDGSVRWGHSQNLRVSK